MSGFVLPPPPPEFKVIHPAKSEAWLDGYIDHFSASSLRMLKVCPEQYRQRYILGRKERPGEALVLGSAVHSAVGFNLTQKIDSHEDLPSAEVVSYFNDHAWPVAVERDGGEDEIRWDSKPDTVRSDGERVTVGYHAVVCPTIQPLAVERRLDFVVPGVPVPFIGYIDFEELTHQVDLKTGKQVQRKPDANWRFQGTIYAAFTGKPTHFHSISRAKTPSIATPLDAPEMVVSPHSTQVAVVERVLRDYAAQVEWYFNRYGPDEPWPTSGLYMDYKGGAACGFCGYRKWCVAWEHERAVDTGLPDIDGSPIEWLPPVPTNFKPEETS
ncbi:MAG TPA: PD-(D/E)XK nuclease family protein [Gaiellaceae bacterium]|jgi:hypothetical protein